MKNVASYIVCIFYIISAIPMIATNYMKYSKMAKELFNFFSSKHKSYKFSCISVNLSKIT